MTKPSTVRGYEAIVLFENQMIFNVKVVEHRKENSEIGVQVEEIGTSIQNWFWVSYKRYKWCFLISDDITLFEGFEGYFLEYLNILAAS